MRFVPKVRPAFLIAMCMALVALASPGVAHADQTKWLAGLPGFGDIVVDDAGGHVFVSPGKTGSHIYVRDLNGNGAQTIANEPGATGMVLSGTKLYVALCDQSAISVIDTTTLTETERISLGTVTLSGTCDLALAGGRLWAPEDDQWTNVVSVTTTSPHTVVEDALGTAGNSVWNPIFPSASGATSSLIIGTAGSSPSTWQVFNVGVSPVTAATAVQSGSNLVDGAITASGSYLVSASGSPYNGARYQLPAITATGTYTTGAYPKSAAVSADGAWSAIGRSSGTKDVYVFPADSNTDVREFDLGTGLEPVSRGTRFNASASKLYVVGSASPYDGPYSLSVFDSPTSGSAQPAAPNVLPAPTSATSPSATAQYTLTGTGFPSASGIVVDNANSHLLIAPGSTGSVIQVRNMDGTAAGTISGESGATGMVLSAGKLYVAMCGYNAIDVIDTATLTRTERIDLGTHTLAGKCTLGIANGRLFYPDSDQWAHVNSVSVAAPHTFVDNVLGSTYYQPAFSTSPAQPNTLNLAEVGISTTTVEAWAVTPTSMTRTSTRDVDGSNVGVTTDAQGTHTGALLRDLTTSNMSIATTYSGDGRDMAYSADGNWVATMSDPWSGTPEIHVYARGDNEPHRSFELLDSGKLEPGNLAFSPSGDKLYVVASPTYSPEAPTLYVMDNPTGPWTAYPDNTTRPTVTGSTPQGSTLTCAAGTWSGSPSFTYAWQRAGVNISGATSATYTTSASDLGKAVSCAVRAGNASGNVSAVSSSSVTVTSPPPPVNVTAPVVSGTPNPGLVLSCSTGTWSGDTPTFAYAWERDTTIIAGQSTANLLLTGADVGATITCVVTASAQGGSTSAASSGTLVAPLPPTTPANTAAPTVSGTAASGATLTCAPGTWTNAPTFAFQWLRGGDDITQATAAAYVVSVSDIGATLSCEVTATNANGSGSAVSAGTTVGSPPLNTVLPTITGAITLGNSLSCVSGTWTNASSFSFTWTRNGAQVQVGHSSSYTLTADDLHAIIVCTVRATNVYGATIVRAPTVGELPVVDSPPTNPTPTTSLPPIPPPTVIPDKPRERVAPAPPLPAPPIDHTQPIVSLAAPAQHLSTALTSGLRITTGCDEACTTVVTIQVSAAVAKQLKLKSRIIGTARLKTIAGHAAPKLVKVKLSARVRAKLAKRRSQTVLIRITSTDAAGNITIKAKTVKLKR